MNNFIISCTIHFQHPPFQKFIQWLNALKFQRGKFMIWWIMRNFLICRYLKMLHVTKWTPNTCIIPERFGASSWWRLYSFEGGKRWYIWWTNKRIQGPIHLLDRWVLQNIQFGSWPFILYTSYNNHNAWWWKLGEGIFLIGSTWGAGGSPFFCWWLNNQTLWFEKFTSPLQNCCTTTKATIWCLHHAQYWCMGGPLESFEWKNK